jgi:hypothetical protein
MHVRLYIDPIITGASWTDMDTVNSCIQVSTVGTISTPGRSFFGFEINSSDWLDVANHAIILEPNRILAFCITPETSIDMARVTANWHEAP